MQAEGNIFVLKRTRQGTFCDLCTFLQRRHCKSVCRIGPWSHALNIIVLLQPTEMVTPPKEHQP
jgi:hypothetical protein